MKSGFPRGTRYTSVPNTLFGPLLEAIEDLAELKCTLRALWLIQQRQKKGHPPLITSEELLSDRVLLIGLKALDVPPPEAIRRGMEKGVERGTFLSLPVNSLSPSQGPSPPAATPSEGGSPRTVPPYQGGIQRGQEVLYFLNDEGGQRAAAMIELGTVDIKGVTPREGVVGEPSEPKANIFALYEGNIGMLTPLLAEELKDAERSYPGPWIEEAFKIAVSHNVRKWRYIEGILRRWATEGKDDGESGRHPAKVSLKEYRRKQGLRRSPG